MWRRTALRLQALVLTLALIPFFLSPPATESRPAAATTVTTQVAPWDPSGPYVDKVIFKVITGSDVQIAAIFSRDIDYIPESIPGNDLGWGPPLDPYLRITETEAFGYACLAVNCQRYPFSIAGFRRALALAIDKMEATVMLWQSLAYPLDSPVPPSCGVWYNNDTYPRFGLADVGAAKAELAAAGFVDIDGDGYVEAPDGNDFTFRVLYPAERPSFGVVFNKCQEYWNQTGILSQPDPVLMSRMFDTLFTVPREYDGALFQFEPNPPEPSPLSLATWTSDQIANPYGNFLDWGNTSYDEILTTMLTSADYEAVLQAAHDAQQVFVHEAPMIVLGSGYVLNAYRTDRFEDWVVSPGDGIGYGNLWVPRKVRLLSNQAERDPLNSCGGTLLTMIGRDMDAQNPLVSTTVYGNYVLRQVYDSLVGPEDPRNHQPIKMGGGLAYDWSTTVLPDGLQFDFILFDNATWHDGWPVTAEDVAFSYNYVKNCTAPKYARGLGYLNSCMAIDNRHVRIVTNGRSYWAFENLRDWPILPKHLWEGIVSPLTFPNPDPIGSGPFRWYRRVAEEYVELRFWDNYHKGIPGHVIWTPWTEPPNPIPLAVLVIVVTLVSSIAYLSRPKRSLAKNGRRAQASPRQYQPPVRKGPAHACPVCGAQLLGDETYCPGCGTEVAYS